MAQRIYWVPHTICFFGCEHCHNDSVMEGIQASRQIIEQVIARLPGPESRYRLDEVLVGGGESLMRNAHMEFLIRTFRERFPRGPEKSIAERRAAGHVILALQTMGFPLADPKGNPVAHHIDYWLNLGIDYFQVASNDMFHERQRPDYPWEALRENLRTYEATHGVEFLVYGKAAARLVPSGRALDHLPALEKEGASLLTEEGYCATAWEAASNFLSGTGKQGLETSEVVIDPYGWVHPCCWYELSPGLFDLNVADFETGMEAMRSKSLCQVLDEGNMVRLAEISGVDPEMARQVRDVVGDCGVCRLCSARLAQQPEHAWIKAAPLSNREVAFYTSHLGALVLSDFFQQTIPVAGRHLTVE